MGLPAGQPGIIVFPYVSFGRRTNHATPLGSLRATNPNARGQHHWPPGMGNKSNQTNEAEAFPAHRQVEGLTSPIQEGHVQAVVSKIETCQLPLSLRGKLSTSETETGKESHSVNLRPVRVRIAID